MLKLCKEEFDRLIETSPIIKEHIILEFKKFKYRQTKQIIYFMIKCKFVFPYYFFQ